MPAAPLSTSKEVQSRELFNGEPQEHPIGRLASSQIFPHLGQKNFSKGITSSLTIVQ